MSAGARPVVGVTGPDRGGLPAWWMTRLAVRRAGGSALRIRPGKPVDAQRLDALILGGGADVGSARGGDESRPPPLPGQTLLRRAAGVALSPLLYLARVVLSRGPGRTRDPARDRLEHALLGEATRRALPVLGICRGAQLMNLSQGGTLVHDVAAFYAERPKLYTSLPRRDVCIERGSLLARVLGVERTRVNSLHAHAVDRPGAGLRVVAREPSGVSQAIEHPLRPFWIGVQWHPEYLPQIPVQRRLFARLVQSARARQGSS